MAKHWIQNAVKKPDALHKALHVKSDKNIPLKRLAVKSSDSKLMKERKNFAKNVRGLHK